MSGSPTQNEDAQPTQFQRKRQKMFICIFVFLLVFFISGKETTRALNQSNLQSSPEPRSFTGVSSKYAPFAQRGDLYTIVVSSGGDGVFAEDTFSNLVLDDDAGELSRYYTLDLRQCHAENRTVVFTITMQIRGTEYSQEFSLLRFLPSVPQRQKRSLFSASKETEDNRTGVTAKIEPTIEWKMYFQPVLTLSPIVDFSRPLPSELMSHYYLDKATQKYLPLLYINNFWVLRDHLQEVNATTAASPFNFTITISPRPLWKFALYVNSEESMKQQQTLGLASSGDLDEIKRIFLETNPYFLCLTFIVTILHMLFEYLAFSNDIQFWRRRKDCKGLSLRTIAMNCYFQTVIFLYLLDGDETSWTILFPTGIGALLEYWKLTQTTRFIRNNDGRWWKWSVKFNEDYDRRTRKHDDLAVRYLMYAMTPVLLFYTVYSAVFDSHKGWYTFLLGTQVRFIYFFGFAMLTPQIFINYKMKSVSQLPWRAFVYRALNTVIDDLFAFIVEMPWLHRLACFRDDVVFLILLYQRWIYPVDAKRGEGSGIDSDDSENEKRDQKEVDGRKEHQASLDNEKNGAVVREAEGSPVLTDVKKNQ